ncbi:CpaF family protein [Paenibacillus turpanensis]|uniref:CpaF family protein n=1 Tax=Paenibacillus turpanensis TaxID=2689078 RepID=UPI0014097737|nr:CpaF family protein [Paenibacillus turpanensis]
MDQQLYAKRCREAVRTKLEYLESCSDEQLKGIVEAVVFGISAESYLTAAEKEQLVSRVLYSFRGLDVLEPLLHDSQVTEIMVNSHEEIFFEKGGRLFTYDLAFESVERLETVIQTIVSSVNRTVNEASPIVDARLADGSRVNVVLPPVALKGPALTIRKFPERPLGLQDLIEKGALTPEAADYLIAAVKDRRNIFISGGTGSGKTTFLNALSQHIPSHERIITIEDSAELQIRTVPNLISLETRNPNTEGKGEITIRQLIKSSLRMRPSRIIVGEVRGAEALDMLQAMNTGHDGSLSTGHANSARDMLSRLETMVLSAVSLPLEVIRQQISSALDVMVHLSRMTDFSRKVVEICEVGAADGGAVKLKPQFVYDPSMECLQAVTKSVDEGGHVR